MEPQRTMRRLLCDKCGVHTKHLFSRYNSGYMGVPKFTDEDGGHLKVMQNIVKDRVKNSVGGRVREHLWRCGACDTERRYGLTGFDEEVKE